MKKKSEIAIVLNDDLIARINNIREYSGAWLTLEQWIQARVYEAERKATERMHKEIEMVRQYGDD